MFIETLQHSPLKGATQNVGAPSASDVRPICSFRAGTSLDAEQAQANQLSDVPGNAVTTTGETDLGMAINHAVVVEEKHSLRRERQNLVSPKDLRPTSVRRHDVIHSSCGDQNFTRIERHRYGVVHPLLEAHEPMIEPSGDGYQIDRKRLGTQSNSRAAQPGQ